MRTSINIKYDKEDFSLLDNYYATSSHTAIIKDVLSGVLSETETRAHIAYGPYGSGKSFITLILDMILSERIPDEKMAELKEKYASVDVDVEQVLNEIEGANKHLVVSLNGFNGAFNEVIIAEVMKELERHKIYLDGYSKKKEILNIVNLWSKNAPILLNDFLENTSKNKKEFIESINNDDNDIINAFSDYYYNISGQRMNKDLSNINLISFLEDVTAKLEEENYSLFIAYDEFGRYLDQLEDVEINKFFQELQDIAELANSGSDNFSVLFVAHKPINHYFKNLSVAQRSEFAKIEKRFTVNQIDSDFTTYLSILKSNLEGVPKSRKKINRTRNLMSKYSLFPSLNDTEKDSLIYEGSYPMHPTSVFLLPRISKVFGQNERSLFSFMYDDNKNGLKGFLKHSNNEYYYPHQLVDYFFVNMDDSYTENHKTFRVYTENIDILNSLFLKEQLERAQNIYKFSMLWTLTNGNAYTLLTTNFISDSLEIPISEVEEYLDTMSKARLMRFNELQNYWEIIESSGIDIDYVIDKQITKMKLSKKDVLKKLDQINPHRYVYSKTYNQEYEITRFAKLSYYTGEQQSDISFKILFTDDDKYVNRIVVPFDYSDIELDVELIEAIDRLVKVPRYKETRVFNELMYERKVIEQRLEETLLKTVSSESNIYFQNKKTKVNNLKEFERFLSDLFMHMYDEYTPINNDQINMFEITVVQKNAIKRVMTEIITYETSNLNHIYTGSRPDDLIWYSINQMDKVSATEAIIQEIKKGSGSVNTLYSKLIQAPFGYRPYVAILLLLFIIVKEWPDIYFMQNNEFIAEIDGNTLFDKIMNKESLQYTYSKFDSENRSYLEQLQQLFPLESEFIQNKSLNIKVCSGLNSWYMSLPVITQQKVGLNIIESTFLRYIEQAKSDPKTALEGIMTDFHSIEDVAQVKSAIERSFIRYKESRLNNLLESYNIKNLKKWAESQNQENKKTNILVRSVITEKTVFKSYAYQIEKLDMKRWPVSTFDKLFYTIGSDIESCSEKIETNKISLDGEDRTIVKAELSNKGKVLKQNLLNTINATKPYLREVEIEQIVYDLIHEYIK